MKMEIIEGRTVTVVVNAHAQRSKPGNIGLRKIRLQRHLPCRFVEIVAKGTRNRPLYFGPPQPPVNQQRCADFGRLADRDRQIVVLGNLSRSVMVNVINRRTRIEQPP